MPAPALLSEPAMVSATGTLDFAGIFFKRRAAGPWLQLSAVGADRFDRAAFHRFLAERFFLGALGLLVNEGVAAIIVALVIRRRGFAAKIAIDALIVDVIGTGNVLRIFVCGVGHILPLKANWKVEGNTSGANRNLAAEPSQARPSMRPTAKSGRWPPRRPRKKKPTRCGRSWWSWPSTRFS